MNNPEATVDEMCTVLQSFIADLGLGRSKAIGLLMD
jgi:hypothetical protein